MWIHIPSNETALEMPRTGKKRSSKQGKGNLRGSTRAESDQEATTSNGECAKEVMIREMRESG